MTHLHPYTANGRTVNLPDKQATPELTEEILKALKTVEGWGSVEIFIQDFSVTQITVRKIKKTKHVLAE